MNKIPYNLIFASFFAFFPVVINSLTDGRVNIAIDFLFVLIIVQSAIFAFGNKALLFKVYFLFSYFFYGVVPYLEYRREIIYWGGKRFTDETYLLVNLLILILNIIFVICYSFFYSKKLKRKSPVINNNISLNGLRSFYILLFLSAFSFLLLLNYNNYSFASLLFRGGDYKDIIDTNRVYSTIYGSFFRFLPMVVFYFFLAFSKDKNIRKTILFIFAMLSAFPLGIPRFMVAALYVPLILIKYPVLTKKYYFSIIMIPGVLFVFPFLNNFRSYSDESSINFLSGWEFLLGGHFDSYQSLARVFQSDIVTWGWQLIGVILFFMPRAFWPDKPIGSGAEIAKIENYFFSNISANFYAEGYINFGVFGCFIFCVLLAWFCANLDCSYIKFKKLSLDYSSLIYFSVVGYLFFFLRGDLLSSYANAIGLLVAYLIVYRIALNFGDYKPLGST